jgi:hypothetical protein
MHDLIRTHSLVLYPAELRQRAFPHVLMRHIARNNV